MTAPTSIWRHRSMRQVALLGIAMSTSYGATLSSVPLSLSERGYAPVRAGLTVTIMLIATIVTQPVVPALVQRYGTRVTQVVGLLALTGTTPLYSVNSLPLAYTVSAVRGAGFGVLTVAGVLLASTVVQPDQRPRAAALYGVATTLPNSVMLPLSVALTDSGLFDWMTWGSLITLLVAPIAYRLDGVPETERATGAVAPRRLSALASALPTGAVLLASALAAGSLTTYLPIVIPSGHTAFLGLLAFGVGVVLARWHIDVLSRRTGRRIALLAGCVVTAIAIVAVGLVTLAHWPVAGALVVLGCAVFGLGCGAIQNLTMLEMVSRTPPQHLAAISALWNLAFDAGTGLGALFVGGLATTRLGVSGGLALTGALVLASGPLVMVRSRGGGSR